MKRIVSGVATAVFGLWLTPAFAQDGQPTPAKVGLQLRVDAVNEKISPEGADSTTSQKFQVSTAKMILSGDISPTVSYVVRTGIRSSGWSTKTHEGANLAMERAYFQVKASDQLTFRGGLLPMGGFSWENEYSSMDQYFYSYLNERFYSMFTGQVGGVDFVYDFMGQSLTLNYGNGYQDSASNLPDGIQGANDTSVALTYRGNLFENMVKPVISYSQVTRIPKKANNGDEDDKVKYTLLGVGAQFNFAGFSIDAEYNSTNRPKYTSYSYDPKTLEEEKPTVKPASENEAEDGTGYVVMAAYNFVDYGLRPLVKYSSSKVDAGKAFEAESTRYAAGIEYRPDPLFRYHAVLVQMNDEENKTEKKTTQIILGMGAKI